MLQQVPGGLWFLKSTSWASGHIDSCSTRSTVTRETTLKSDYSNCYQSISIDCRKYFPEEFGQTSSLNSWHVRSIYFWNLILDQLKTWPAQVKLTPGCIWAKKSDPVWPMTLANPNSRGEVLPSAKFMWGAGPRPEARPLREDQCFSRSNFEPNHIHIFGRLDKIPSVDSSNQVHDHHRFLAGSQAEHKALSRNCRSCIIRFRFNDKSSNVEWYWLLFLCITLLYVPNIVLGLG
jgi:hypothetical protein